MQKEWFSDLWCEQFRREALYARYGYAFLPCGPSCMNTRIAWGQLGKVVLAHLE